MGWFIKESGRRPLWPLNRSERRSLIRTNSQNSKVTPMFSPFPAECAVMKEFRHPNIVMFYGAVVEPPNYCLVLEFCSRGSLWELLHKQELKMEWPFKKKLALDVAKGVHYLHSMDPPKLHRDLKSLNVVIDQACNAKLADFGWTRAKGKRMTTKIGTYQWMAPEVIVGVKYTEKADVFSYGIILWEIATRDPPYLGIDGAEVSRKVVNEDYRPIIPRSLRCPKPFQDLMERCWDREPSNRPTFDSVIDELNAMKFDS